MMFIDTNDRVVTWETILWIGSDNTYLHWVYVKQIFYIERLLLLFDKFPPNLEFRENLSRIAPLSSQ
jgi:hypothetical protein